MQKKSNRWFIWLFVVVAVVALFGFSFGSIFDSIISSRPSPSPTVPTPGTTPTPPAVSETEKKNLQDLENGYLQILEKEPDNSDALLGLAEARSQMIKIGLKTEKDLIKPLEKLVELNPEQTQYKVLLAQTLQKTGQRESAAQTYRSILATQPGNMDALQGFVNLLVEQQRPSAATDLLQTTLKNAPQANQVKPNSINESAVRLLLGQVYVTQKQLDQALEVYDKLIASDPNDFRPVFAKAILLREQGKIKEAGILFNTAEKLAPGQYKDQIKAAAQEEPASAPPSSNSQPPSSSNPQPSPDSAPIPTE